MKINLGREVVQYTPEVYKNSEDYDFVTYKQFEVLLKNLVLYGMTYSTCICSLVGISIRTKEERLQLILFSTISSARTVIMIISMCTA